MGVSVQTRLLVFFCVRLAQNCAMVCLLSCGLSPWLAVVALIDNVVASWSKPWPFRPQIMENIVEFFFFVPQTMETIGEAIQLVPSATSIRGADCGLPCHT